MTLNGSLGRFFEHEHVDGNGRVRAYLDRWVLAKFRRSAYYLHRFSGSDWSTDLHDHPKPFLSIGLWGSYIEHTALGATRYSAPWLRRFPASFAHRLELDEGAVVWTFVRVGAKERDWGFFCDGQWVQWSRYVHSDLPERRGAVRTP